ncbi:MULTISPECIES: Zn-ribbon domain-containing OB-fold protein [unclassified Kitasatospora]|uniref:Zn-ribbon domain-containing OB-fold protein n=1 Tax=unclassified Kitasatospora TaxID=2633591 RepID=UPI003821B2E6
MTLTLAPSAPHAPLAPFEPFAEHPFPAHSAGPAGEAELDYRRCQWCHSASAASCLLCPVCGSADLSPARACGQGTVQRLLRPTRRGPHLGRPYLIVLDEGFTVQATVLGGLPGAVPIGARVHLVTSEEGGRTLTFRLAPRP